MFQRDQPESCIQMKRLDSSSTNKQTASPLVVGRTGKQKIHTPFTQRLEDLRSYKVKHGHVNVEKSDSKSLYKFCCDLRHARRKGINAKTVRLDDDRVASLDALGFVWSPPLAGGVPAAPNANAIETRGIRPTKEVNDGGAMKQPASKVSSKKHSSSGSTTNSNKGIDKQKWWEGQITVEECVNQAAEAPPVAPPEEAHLDTNKNKLEPLLRQ